MRATRQPAAALAALAVLVAPAAAGASYGEGAEMVSADYVRQEQGDDATVFAAISADGRYVAMQTRARNFFADDDPDPPGAYRTGGVFRFDLATRTLQKVADGDLFDEATNAFLRRGASNPSINADGRFVAFATAEPLVAADTNDNVDVYVRDMDATIGSPGAFDLVSARDGGDVPAAYGPPPSPFPGSNPGSDVSRGVSINADGQRVAFRTEAPSNMPAAATSDVPAGQIFLRDRATNTTTLVTRRRTDGTPAGGGLGAALSADGSTVAWTGSNAAAQTRFLPGENQEPSFLYYLWRRIADGPAAPTRRITGLADPDDPACPPGAVTSFDQISTGPCYGPLTDQEDNRSSIVAQLPALSGDGYRVAFLTGAGPRPQAFTGPGLDLWLTDMSPGLTRKQATVELTRDPAASDPAAGPPIGGVAMSRDGTHVAITTPRTSFTGPPLQPLGSHRTVPGVRELYVIDLAARTVDRVARSYTGGDIDGDVQNGATINADGSRVAFSSFAGNLFFGDANSRADAFVADRDPTTGAQPPPPADDGPPGSIDIDADGPGLRARAKAGRKGEIRIAVTVPDAGDVKAVVKARAGKPRKPRTLATARKHADGAGELGLVLRPVQRYRAELRKRGKIAARVQIDYVASSGGERLSANVRVALKQR